MNSRTRSCLDCTVHWMKAVAITCLIWFCLLSFFIHKHTHSSLMEVNLVSRPVTLWSSAISFSLPSPPTCTLCLPFTYELLNSLTSALNLNLQCTQKTKKRKGPQFPSPLFLSLALSLFSFSFFFFFFFFLVDLFFLLALSATFHTGDLP